jgi:hypothetical protein
VIHGWIENGIKFGLDYYRYFGYPPEEGVKEIARWLSLNPNGTFEDYKVEQDGFPA